MGDIRCNDTTPAGRASGHPPHTMTTAEQGMDGGSKKVAAARPRSAHTGRRRPTNMVSVHVVRRRGHHSVRHVQCHAHATHYRMRAPARPPVWHSYSPEHYHTYGELELSQPSTC